MSGSVFWPALAVMAITTYLVRMLPLVLCRAKIRNRFVRSFLAYVPYAVLAAMTIPGILYATDSVPTAAVGLAVALCLSYFEKPLLLVALCASAGVYLAQFFC